MNDLRIEFTIVEWKHEINGLSLGHMMIEGKYGTHSSMNKTPDQSMMIFISIFELLDGIRYLVKNPTYKKYDFVGTDCSFRFTIKKKKDKILIIRKKNEIISRTNINEFIKVVFDETQKFVKKYEKFLVADETVGESLYGSIKDFEDSFCDIVNSQINQENEDSKFDP